MEKRKINKGLVFLYVFMLLPFLKLHRINEMIGSSGMKLYMILSFFSLVVVFFAFVNKIKLTKTLCCFIFHQGTILFSTFLFRGFQWGSMLVIFVDILVFILTTVHLREIVSSVCIVLVPSIIINFFSVLFAAGEIGEMFFLGGKNALGIVIIPTIFILFLNSLYKNNKISSGTICISVFGFLSIILAGSATGIVTSVAAVAFLVFNIKFIPKKYFWFGSLVFIYAIFLFFSEKFFASDMWISFVKMLGKDATLTSRTRIWSAVSELIRTRLFLGFGKGLEFSYSTTHYYGVTQFETHNIALQMLLEGGLVAMISFVLFLFYCIKRLDMNEVKHRIIFAAIMVLLVNGLTESVANTMYSVLTFSIANAYVRQEDAINTDKVII